jgi:Protein of unknown function (DUF3352)
MSDQPTPPEEPNQVPPIPDLEPASPAVPSGLGVDPGPGTPPGPPNEPNRGRRGLLVGAVVALAVVLVAGGAAAFFSMRGSDEELLTRLPADTQLVVTAYLDPSAGQKANLFRLTEQFPILGSREQLTERLDQLIGEMLPQSGLSRGDLDWIGVEAAFAGKIDGDGEPSGGILIDADDEAGARAALDKSWEASGSETTEETYEGVEITIGPIDGPGTQEVAAAVFDGAVVIGFGKEFVHGVIDTVNGGPALADDAGFRETVEPLPTGRLGLLYVNPAAAIEALGPGLVPAGQSMGFEGILGYGMTLSAEPDGLAIDGNAALDPSKLPPAQRDALAQPDHENPLLAAVPSDAYGVAVSQHVDLNVEAFIETLRDTAPEAIGELEEAGIIGSGGILNLLTGDLAVEAGPGDGMPVGGVLMLGTTDDAQMQRSLDKFANMLLEEIGSFDSNPFPISPVDAPSEFTTLSLTDDGPFLRRFDPRWRTRTYDGVRIRVLDADASAPPVSYVVVDGVAMLGSSPDQIVKAIDTLREDADSIASEDRFTAAVKRIPDSDALFYLNVAGIAAAVRESLAPLDRGMYDGFVAPNLEPIQAVVAGMQSDETHQSFRFFILIR